MNRPHLGRQPRRGRPDLSGACRAQTLEIRIVGVLDARTAAEFAGLDLTSDGNTTKIYAELDQAGLHGLLERIRSLDLELREVRQVRL